MHLPLISRILFLLVQFLILTMALPAARQASTPAAAEQLTEREAIAESNADGKDAAPVRRSRFAKRVEIQKLDSPVRAMVRSPDTVVPREKAE